MSLKRIVVALNFLALSAVPAFAVGVGARPKQQQERKQSETAPPPRQEIKIPTIDTSRPLSEAKKEIATARAEEKKALNTVNQIRAKLMKTADTDPKIVAAAKASAKAKAEYDAAVAPIIAALENSADYQALQASVVQADQKVAALKADDEATPEARIAAAKQAKVARSAVSELRSEALADNSSIASTKESYETAANALAKLRSDFQKSISDDPSLVAAVQSLDEAKSKTKEADQKVADANAALVQQRKAREVALAEQRKLERENAQPKEPQRGSKPR